MFDELRQFDTTFPLGASQSASSQDFREISVTASILAEQDDFVAITVGFEEAHLRPNDETHVGIACRYMCSHNTINAVPIRYRNCGQSVVTGAFDQLPGMACTFEE